MRGSPSLALGILVVVAGIMVALGLADVGREHAPSAGPAGTTVVTEDTFQPEEIGSGSSTMPKANTTAPRTTTTIVSTPPTAEGAATTSSPSSP